MGLLKTMTKAPAVIGAEELAKAETVLAQQIAAATARVDALEAPQAALSVEDLVQSILAGAPRDEDRTRELEAARQAVADLEADRERLRGARAGVAAQAIVTEAAGLRDTVATAFARLAEAFEVAAAAQREAEALAITVEGLIGKFSQLDAIVDRTGAGPRLRFPIDVEEVAALRVFRAQFVDDKPNTSRYTAWRERCRLAGWVQ